MVRLSHKLLSLFPSGLLTTPPREYRRTVGAHLRKGSPSDRAEKILALLIESGFVYCLLWVNPSPAPPRSKLLTSQTMCVRQIFYLLTAFSVLPGSGSYTVNLVMLFLSVRQSRLLSDHLG